VLEIVGFIIIIINLSFLKYFFIIYFIIIDIIYLLIT